MMDYMFLCATSRYLLTGYPSVTLNNMQENPFKLALFYLFNY